MVTKIINYVLSILGGVIAGLGIMFVLTGLEAGTLNYMWVIGLIVGVVLIGGGVAVSRRSRKSVGLGLSGIGATMFGVGIVLILIALSRDDVQIGAVSAVVGGFALALGGLWIVSRFWGREVALDRETPEAVQGLGVAIAIAGGLTIFVGWLLGTALIPMIIGAVVLVTGVAAAIAFKPKGDPSVGLRRAAATFAYSFGAVIALAGLALVAVGFIGSLNVLSVFLGMIGIILYLIGLFMSQTDDDMREIEGAIALRENADQDALLEEAHENKKTFKTWFGQLGLLHIVALIAVIYAAFPIVYIFSASLNPGGTLTGSNVLFAETSTSNYTSLGETRFWEWLGNSLFVGVITSIATVLMGAGAAYAFSRYRFRGRRGGLISLLIVQMFPQILAFVAIFLLLMTFGFVWAPIGLNSKVALIAVYLGGALGANTFLMYGFFNTIPASLDEAAKIDGATHAQIFWTIILRLVAPILAVVGLLSFVGTFNEFIIAKLILQSEQNWTLAVGMYQWVSSLLNQNWGLFAAGAMIGAIPILILFLFLQKYIVGGLTAGSVKG